MLAINFCATPCSSAFSLRRTRNSSTTGSRPRRGGVAAGGRGQLFRSLLAPRRTASKIPWPSLPLATLSEIERARANSSGVLGTLAAISVSTSSRNTRLRGKSRRRASFSRRAASSRRTAKVRGLGLRSFNRRQASSGATT